MTSTSQTFQAIRWENDQLILLDQRKLPADEIWIRHQSVSDVVASIRDMVVRGAPAIGITAAYGVVTAGRLQFAAHQAGWKAAIQTDLEALAGSRPTAINLFWAIDRMKLLIEALPAEQDPFAALLAEAKQIHDEDIQANFTMGELGADLIVNSDKRGLSVITHCNTGTLATGGYGTALGVIRSAYKNEVIDKVFADETRPWLQGSRLTAWELTKDGIPVTLNADGAAAHLMASGKIGWVIVGSDRITANGDVANKIGTYSLAVLARFHGVKFMVVAPTSTFDMELKSGKDIPIEERTSDEVLTIGGKRIAPAGCEAFNPVFDVTPADLVDAIVTEKGVIERPSLESVAKVLG